MPLLRTTGNVALANVLGIAVLFATSVIVARALGPTQKGAYDLMVATAGLAALVLGLSVAAGITYTVARGAIDGARVPSAIALWGAASGAIVFTLLITFPSIAVAFSIVPAGVPIAEPAAIAALAAVTVFAAGSKAALAGRQRVARAGWMDLAGRAAGLALCGVVAVVGPRSPLTFLLAAAAGVTLAGLLQAAAVRPHGVASGLDVRRVLGFALPSHAGNILQFLNYRMDLFLVGFFRGSLEVGLYVVAASIGQLIWILSTAVGAAIFPSVAAADDPSAAVARTSRAARVALFLSATCALALAVASTVAIPAFYGIDFAPSVGPLLLLLPGVVLFAPVTIIAAYFAGIGRPDLNVRISGVGFLVTLVLDLALIPAFGMLGAAVASSASYSVALLATVILLGRLTGRSSREVLWPDAADVRKLWESLRVHIKEGPGS
jgi:O-antigen/teichoic acid export membrane protein